MAFKDQEWMKEDAARNLRDNYGIFWDGKSFQKVKDPSTTPSEDNVLAKSQTGSISISSPDDEQEIEADRVADRVMRESLTTAEDEEKKEEESIQRQTNETSLTHGTASDRSPTDTNVTPVENDEPFQDFIQRKSGSPSDRALDSSTETEVRNLQGKGSPLPDGTKESMEKSFGADFSGVRVHTDSRAAELSQKLNAKAFTYGNNIAFNKNEFSPDTPSGKRLLAHELAHTVQLIFPPNSGHATLLNLHTQPG